MKGGFTRHVVHVAGTRMMAQGTDGVSRDSLMEGVMAGGDMLDHVDLAKTALEKARAVVLGTGLVWGKELGLPHAGGMVCGRAWYNWRLPR
jgi:hypothetical protein